MVRDGAAPTILGVHFLPRRRQTRIYDCSPGLFDPMVIVTTHDTSHQATSKEWLAAGIVVARRVAHMGKEDEIVVRSSLGACVRVLTWRWNLTHQHSLSRGSRSLNDNTQRMYICHGVVGVGMETFLTCRMHVAGDEQDTHESGVWLMSEGIYTRCYWRPSFSACSVDAGY